jgi:hypothetical protein
MPLGDDEGLARFGEPIESVDGDEVGRLQPNDSWRIDGWNPTPEGEHMTTETTRKELAQHLPDEEWEIVEWEPWGPKKKKNKPRRSHRLPVPYRTYRRDSHSASARIDVGGQPRQ